MYTYLFAGICFFIEPPVLQTKTNTFTNSAAPDEMAGI